MGRGNFSNVKFSFPFRRATTNANDRGIYGKIRRGDAGAVGDARIDEFITPILRERVPETVNFKKFNQ
jgi:hypothetical protein